MFMLSLFSLANLSVFSLAFAKDNPYDSVLKTTTNDTSLKSAIDWWDVVNDGKWSELFNNQVLKVITYIIDIFIVIWIAVAFFGWYKIMFSDKEDSMHEGIKFLIFWILWIIIMVSARFIATSLVWETGIITDQFANVSDEKQPNWIEFASNLYETILYPFIKIALYFVVWILFFIMAGKVIGFVTATDDSSKQKAWGIIIWCVVWILIVMWSKQIVEAVMWKQDMVLQNQAQWVDEQGNPILEFENVPIIAQIINWVMWLTMFAILVLIVIQWYKIFTKPGDSKTMDSLKKTILYVLIWVAVIGAAYVISNFLVVNKVPIADVV